jgi:hypothetical protein
LIKPIFLSGGVAQTKFLDVAQSFPAGTQGLQRGKGASGLVFKSPSTPYQALLKDKNGVLLLSKNSPAIDHYLASYFEGGGHKYFVWKTLSTVKVTDENNVLKCTINNPASIYTVCTDGVYIYIYYDNGGNLVLSVYTLDGTYQKQVLLNGYLLTSGDFAMFAKDGIVYMFDGSGSLSVIKPWGVNVKSQISEVWFLY